MLPGAPGAVESLTVQREKYSGTNQASPIRKTLLWLGIGVLSALFWAAILYWLWGRLS